MKKCFLGWVLFSCSLWGQTIHVPAGAVQCEKPRILLGEKCIKTGPGTLDLSFVTLKNEGLIVEEGAVIFKIPTTSQKAPSCRFLRWNVTETRPTGSGNHQGSQFSEFRLYRNGKIVPFPKSTRAFNPVSYEGPQFGIDGNIHTKCFRNPLVIDFGEDVAFDGYSFVTANDCIGRDPRSWILEAGFSKTPACAQIERINWIEIGSMKDFDTPTARWTEAGKIFPVTLLDIIPPHYSVLIQKNGKLILENAHETLEQVQGSGLIELHSTHLVCTPQTTFTGSIFGSGSVRLNK